MKKLLTIIVLLLGMSTFLPAQQNKGFDPKAYKVELQTYVIKHAGVTEAEAQKFFAIYEEMRQEERKIFSKIGEGWKQKPSTEEECRKAILETDEREIQLKKLQQQYHLKMLKVLPATKVMPCLFFSEKFDRKKFREMSSRKKENPGGHNRNDKGTKQRGHANK